MDHPGHNNAFETKTGSKLAILYNDVSVLENHHAASFFFLTDNNKTNCNIFKNIPDKEKIEARKMIIENILCTDMSKHIGLQNELKAINDLEEEKRELDTKNKPLMMKSLVHAADIGNPSRPYEIAKMWSEKIVAEFFQQGDKERALGLDISMLCDRHTTNFAKSQIGFGGFLTGYFAILSDLVPKLGFTV